MQPWFIYSLIALFIWGLYGFFPKLTTGFIDPKSAMVFQSLGGLIVGIFVLIFALKLKPEVHPKGILFAVLKYCSISDGIVGEDIDLRTIKSPLPDLNREPFGLNVLSHCHSWHCTVSVGDYSTAECSAVELSGDMYSIVFLQLKSLLFLGLCSISKRSKLWKMFNIFSLG